MGERMDIFVLFHNLTNINGKSKREMHPQYCIISNTTKSSNWHNFFPSVPFLNLSAKKFYFKKTKACTYLDISTASKSVPLKAPSSFAIMKFCVNLLIPIPSVIVSNGFLSLCPSASSPVYITPLVTLLNKPGPGGSIRKHLMFGFFSC